QRPESLLRSEQGTHLPQELGRLQSRKSDGSHRKERLASVSLPCRLPAPKEVINFLVVVVQSVFLVVLNALVDVVVQLCDVHPESRLQPARVKLLELLQLLVLVFDVYEPFSKLPSTVVVVSLNTFVSVH